ncbi:MAG: signal peptidase I [Leptospiraceae bacterium]|nr:signal peptidase I [Leptospiraceae bacterium]MCP5500855.1 signal peptidase I [Leptospiraceae bacterium]
MLYPVDSYDPSQKNKKGLKPYLVRSFLSIPIAFLLSFLVKTFLLYPLTVKTNTMAPGILPGKTAYIKSWFSVQNLQYGDIILFKNPQNDALLLARVIASSGDKIQIRNKTILKNGRILQETYKILQSDKRKPFRSTFSRRDNLDTIQIKKGYYWLMVDNRDEGLDSRELGPIPENAIVGKLLF